MNANRLLAHYERIADAPDVISRMRRFILDLAVRGKLVEQDPEEEPASELLKRIGAEKARLVKAREIKKPKPSLSIDEPPFDLPANWCWALLGEISAYIQRGKSPKYTAANGSPVVSQKCVQWDGLDLTVAKLVTLESLEKYDQIRVLRDGDLLWNSTGTGTIGRVIRLLRPQPKLVCDSHVTVVRCLLADPEYVRTWLRTDYVYGAIEERAAGSTNQVELTAQMANGQPVPLPPLAEQHRIAAKVDELMALCDRLEAARADREATRDRLTAASLVRLNAPDPDPAIFRVHTAFALENLAPLTARSDQIKAQRQTILNLAVRGKLVEQDLTEGTGGDLSSSLYELLGTKETGSRGRRAVEKRLITKEEEYLEIPKSWAWVRLHEIGITQTGTSPSSSNPELFGNFISFVKPADLDGGSINYDGPGLSKEGMNHSRVAVENSVMMVCIGATLGKVNVTDRTVCFNQQINSVTPYMDGLHGFLAIALRASGFQERAWSKAGTGTLPIISKGKWEVLPTPLPPLAEQHRIVAKVDELMALCDWLDASLAATTTTRQRLLKALLHEALVPGEEREEVA